MTLTKDNIYIITSEVLNIIRVDICNHNDAEHASILYGLGSSLTKIDTGSIDRDILVKIIWDVISELGLYDSTIQKEKDAFPIIQSSDNIETHKEINRLLSSRIKRLL